MIFFLKIIKKNLFLKKLKIKIERNEDLKKSNENFVHFVIITFFFVFFVKLFIVNNFYINILQLKLKIINIKSEKIIFLLIVYKIIKNSLYYYIILKLFNY